MASKRVAVVSFQDIKNAYIIISCHRADTGNGIQKNMSFFYGDSEKGTEWEPDNGPITRITKCDKGDEGAKEHWFYDYYTGQGDWSQLAVEDEDLPGLFLGGHFEDIFAVLKTWSE